MTGNFDLIKEQRNEKKKMNLATTNCKSKSKTHLSDLFFLHSRN